METFQEELLKSVCSLGGGIQKERKFLQSRQFFAKKKRYISYHMVEVFSCFIEAVNRPCFKTPCDSKDCGPEAFFQIPGVTARSGIHLS